MSAPTGPVPVQWTGETAAHYALRLQQYFIPATGPAVAMAEGWMKLFTGPLAPKAFDIK